MQIRTYAFGFGQLQCFALYDLSHIHTAEELIVNPHIAELEKITAEFDFTCDEIHVGYNNLLLKTQDQNILVDAGIGEPIGQLNSAFEALGIEPDAIGTIIITHSDRDHIGGILDQDGEIAFPNARYIMLEDIWQHWASEESRADLTRLNKWTEEKAQFAWEIYIKIEDRIDFVKPGEEFMPGFQLYPAPGHRYDHSFLRVISDGEILIHIADALAHPLFMAKREWYSTYDANPAQAVETKINVLNDCAAERAIVFGPHFPFPGLGYVQAGHDRWVWQPITEVG
jgi:glyoxylase-like metal-dependent hydrolase (beta-lactamase superfamily II)